MRCPGVAAGGGRQLQRRALLAWMAHVPDMVMWILGSMRTSTMSRLQPLPATLLLAGVLQDGLQGE